MIEILPLGSPVKFGRFEGHILRIQLSYPIETPNVMYQVGYWDHNEHWTEQWCETDQITSTVEKVPMGFTQKPAA